MLYTWEVRNPGTPWIGRCVVPRTAFDVAEKNEFPSLPLPLIELITRNQNYGKFRKDTET